MQLEENHLNKYGQPNIAPPKSKANGSIQMTLFEWKDNAVVDRLKSLEIERMTPIEALQQLEALRRQAKESN